MSLIDMLIGGGDLRSMRNQAQRAARIQYDPAQLSPQLSQFRDMATEGIGESEDIARRQAVSNLFRQPSRTQTGNAGRELAMQQDIVEGMQRNLAQSERQLAQTNIQARQQGEQGFAQTRTQQEQLERQRDAAVRNAQLQYEAERSRRKQQLGATALGVAGSLATTPFGDGGSLVERGLGKLFSSGSEQEVADGDFLNAFMSMDFSDDPEGQMIANGLADMGALPQVDYEAIDWTSGGSVTPTDLGGMQPFNYTPEPEQTTTQQEVTGPSRESFGIDQTGLTEQAQVFGDSPFDQGATAIQAMEGLGPNARGIGSYTGEALQGLLNLFMQERERLGQEQLFQQ